MLDLVCLSPIDATIVNNEKGHRVFFPDKNLRLFRDKADFDLVFCTLMNFQGETDRLCEDFCQCRMLLKPGGKFFLHVKNDKAKSFMEIFMLKKGGVAAGILSRVGLSNIVERRLPHGQLLSFGQRPFSNF
ncbi:MAG: hypothetical protein KKD01_11180 [Proteobacteria bacterium]|nr:hypothetical protein [Pseudomonadota bacterium]MBU1418204.1 hypothetical protein [Pseudomonadota bacterium]MBU1455278.1 hypothetical protein [Pseudomonadota bacterium]